MSSEGVVSDQWVSSFELASTMLMSIPPNCEPAFKVQFRPPPQQTREGFETGFA